MLPHFIKRNKKAIILIVAGFFESGFAFCLGKMKESSGTDWYLWGAGFLLSLTLSMVLLAKAVQTLPIGTAYPVWTGIKYGIVGKGSADVAYRYRLSGVDRYWCGRYSGAWHRVLSRAGILSPSFLHLYFDSLHYRIEAGLTLMSHSLSSYRSIKLNTANIPCRGVSHTPRKHLRG